MAVQGMHKSLLILLCALACCVVHIDCLAGFGAVFDVSPWQGSTAGGTEMHIAGTGFADVEQVLIGGQECAIFYPSVKDGELFCYAPPDTSVVPTGKSVEIELVWNSGYKAKYSKGLKEFYYSPYLTPSVRNVDTPAMGVLDNVTFTGNLLEKLMGGQDFMMDLLGEKRNATRVMHAYLGSGLHVMSDKGGEGEYRCDIIDTPGDKTGICEVKAGMPAGYYNFTYVLSKTSEIWEHLVAYGKGYRSPHPSRVSTGGQLFDVEVFPTLHSITGTPKVGILGGTEVVLEADGLDVFFRSDSEHSVTLAGVPCEVTVSSRVGNDDFLSCTTGPVSSRESYYPGSQTNTWESQTAPIVGIAPHLYSFPESRKRDFDMMTNVELVYPLAKCTTAGDQYVQTPFMDTPGGQYSLDKCAEICFRIGVCKFFYFTSDLGNCRMCETNAEGDDVVSYTDNVKEGGRRRWATWEPAFRNGGIYQLKQTGRQYLEAHSEGPNWKLVSSYQKCKGTPTWLTWNEAWVGLHGADVQTCADQCAMNYIDKEQRIPCKYFGLYSERNTLQWTTDERTDTNKVRCVIYGQTCELETANPVDFFGQDQYNVYEIKKATPSFPQLSGFYPGGRGVFYRVWNACPEGAIYIDSSCWTSWWVTSPNPFGALYAGANPEYAAQTPMFEGLRADALMGPFGKPLAMDNTLDKMEAYDSLVPYPKLSDASSTHGLVFELFAFFVPPFTATYSFFTWGANLQDIWVAQSADQTDMVKVAESLIGQPCGGIDYWFGGEDSFLGCSVFYESTNGQLIKDSEGWSGTQTTLRTPSLQTMQLNKGEKRLMVKRVSVPPNTYGWGGIKPTDYEGSAMRIHKPDLSSLSTEAKAALGKYQAWPEIVRFKKSATGYPLGFFKFGITVDGQTTYSSPVPVAMTQADLVKAFNTMVLPSGEQCLAEAWGTGSADSVMLIIWKPGGNLANIQLDTSTLQGDVTITVDTVADGDSEDLFIYPIMGTFLEAPATAPQVQLSTIGITARNGNLGSSSGNGTSTVATPSDSSSTSFDYTSFNYDVTSSAPSCTLQPPPSDTQFRYLNLTILEVANGPSVGAVWLEIAELYMWGPGNDGTAQSIDLSAATITSSVSASSGTAVANMVDGDINTVMKGGGQSLRGSPSEVVFGIDLGDGKSAYPLMWAYATGSSWELDPQKWILAGSNDGVTWTNLTIQDTWPYDRYPISDRYTVVSSIDTELIGTCSETGVGLHCGWGFTFPGTADAGVYGDLDTPQAYGSWSECQQRCCYDERCKSATFDDSTKLCTKFSRFFEPTYSPSATAVVANLVSRKTASDDGYAVTERSVEDEGETLVNYTGHQSVNYCKKMCNANPDCHSFTWSEIGGCSLKKACVTKASQLCQSTDARAYTNVTYYQVYPQNCAPVTSSGPSTVASQLRYGLSGTGNTSFEFEYLSQTESPFVEELLVNGAASTEINEGDTVAIKGGNFDLQGGTGEITVYIGTFKCLISASSSSEISCAATANSHKRLNVKVMVGWKGWADFSPLLKPQDGQPRGQMAITFGGGQNVVTGIKPSSGSMLGGTRIVISGKGFDTVSALNSVLLGSVVCSMRSVTISQIECVTPQQGFASTAEMIVSVNGVSTSSDGGDLRFKYDEAVTPTVTAVSPSALSFAVTSSVTISGSKFGFIPTYLTVKFGDRACRVLNADDTSISCQLSRTTVTDTGSASLSPTVMIAGVGYAKIASSAVLDTSFAMYSVSPSVGSQMGGCEVKITGIGFSSSAVTSQRYAAVLGTFGDIISWSPTEIVMTTRKAVQSTSLLEVNVNLIPALHLCGAGQTPGPCIHDAFSQDSTPSVTSLSANSGRAGDKLTAVIAMPSGYISNVQAADVTMYLGTNICPLDASALAKDGDSLTVTCVVPEFEASVVEAQILVKPLGYSEFVSGVSASFTQRLIIDSISPNEGSMAGRDVVLSGAGFSTKPMRHFVRVGEEYGICEPTSSSYSQLACTINYRRFVPSAISSPDAQLMAFRPKGFHCSKRDENILKVFKAEVENTTGWTAARDACNEFCLQEASCNACSYYWHNWVEYHWRALKECGTETADWAGCLDRGDVSIKVRPKEVSQAFTRYAPGWICLERNTNAMQTFWTASNSDVDREAARNVCEDFCLKDAGCWGCTVECWYVQCWWKAISSCPTKYWNSFEQIIPGGLTEKTLVKQADVDLSLWSTEVSAAPLTAFAGRMIGCMQDHNDWPTTDCISEEECALRCLTQVGCASFEFTARFQTCVLSKTSFSACGNDCLEAGADDCVYYEKKTTASSANVPQGFTYKYASTPTILEVWTKASGAAVAGVQTSDTGCGQQTDGICCASPHQACSWGEGSCSDDSQCAGSLSCMSHACSWSPLTDAVDPLAAKTAYENAAAPTGYGCFIDGWNRDLPDIASDAGGWSTADCAEACSGYLYFGLQSNGYCFCGQTFGMHGRATDCPDCTPDSYSYGNYRNCVFENGVVDPWASISATAACGGESLATLTATHLECKTKCVESPTCQAIDYYSATSQCLLHTSACGSPTDQANGASSQRITLSRWTLYIPPYEGTKACGGAYTETLTDSTKEACEAKCLETASCVGFDFMTETSVCGILDTLCDTPEQTTDGGSTFKLSLWVREWASRDELKKAADAAEAPPESCCVAQGNNKGFISTDVSSKGNEVVVRMEGSFTASEVSFGGVSCPIKKTSSGQGLLDVTCELGEVAGGLKHHALVDVAGYGKAFDAYNWISVPLTVDGVSAVGLAAGDRSLGGGWHLKITGQGFAPAASTGASTSVEATVCGRKCIVSSSSYSELTCVAPKVYTPELYASGTEFGLQLPLTRVISNNAGLPDAEAPQCFSGRTADEFMADTSECMSIFDQETEVLGGVSGSGCQFGLDFGEFTSVRIEQIRFFPPFDTYTAPNYINGKWQVGELDELEHANCNEMTYGWHGVDYRGCQTITTTGSFCESWDVAMPDLVAYHPELAGHSSCRNPLPTQWDQIWCVTKETGEKQACNRRPPPIVWTTVHVVEKAPKMLWNSHSLSTPLVTRFVRFQNPTGDCRMNEVQVIGNLVAKTSSCGVAVRNVRRMSGDLTPLDLTRPGYGSFLSAMTDWVTSAANPVTFSASVTPYVASIEPMNGTARGGTTITLKGSQFGSSWSTGSSTDSPVTVTFNGYSCDVTSVTETIIQCVTSARNQGINPPSTVIHLAGVGNALIHPQVTFRYLDPWSDAASWADQEPPFDGDMVIVPSGQAISVDVDTPILNSLIVEGVLVFDDTKDVHLQAHYIWVKGGTFEIGTEQRPFLHKALVTLHGNKYDAIRLPVVGAKCLAVSNEKFTIRDGGDGAPEEGRIGTLDIHGAPRKTVWTMLTETIKPGATIVKVKNPVDFVAGEVLLITSTKTPDKHFDGNGMFGAPPVDFEDEEVIVASVESDMRTIHLTTPVKHEHISTKFTRPDGEVIELSAEVGLLSRNVKIQGDETSDRDSWGGHTMNAFGGVYRIENAEFYRMGQTAELSRYPIHFHVARDWGKQGYVKYNSIHTSFQRAVTIHATDYVLVEGNIGFKTMGHMFFVETGMEKYNVFQGNLAVGAIPLLSGVVESDMEPSGFWTATPQNFWRDNVAVTGSDGWYFQLPVAPLFHSQAVYGRSICPQGEHLGEATGNRCHHISGTCMRVYHVWKPMKDPCNEDSEPAPQVLYNTTCWGNGFMCFNAMFGGSLHNHHMTSIETKGIDLWMERHSPSTWTGIASVKDSVFVGILPENLNSNSPQKWKASVIEMPQDENFLVENSHFINFLKVPVFQDCSGCYNNGKWQQGAYTYHFSGLTFHNSSKRLFVYKKGIFHDGDGSLVGTPSSYTTWADSFNILPSACTTNAGSVATILDQPAWAALGSVHDTGSRADPTDSIFHIIPPSTGSSMHKNRDYKFITCDRPVRQFAVVDPDSEVALQPLRIKNIETGAHQTYDFEDKGEVGWVFPVLSNSRYEVQPNLTGLDLSASSLRYSQADYFKLKTQQATKAKQVPVTEWLQMIVKSDSTWDHYELLNPDEIQVGSWVKEQKLVQEVPYLRDPAPLQAPANLPSMAHGMIDSKNWAVNFRFPAANSYDLPLSTEPNTARFTADRCPVLGCTLGFTPVDLSSLTQESWASKIGAASGQDVVIDSTEWILFDMTAVVSIKSLVVKGRLSFSDAASRVLETGSIIVYGLMEVGTEAAPFGATNGNTATIRLTGALADESYLEIGEHELHGKSIAVLGALQAHGAVIDNTWGTLHSTVAPGATSACVRGVTGWPAGSEFVISSTDFDNPAGDVETGTLASGSAGSGCWSIGTTGPFGKNHYAGDVDVGNGKSVYLGAVVGRLDRTVVFESKDVDGENLYGGHIEVVNVPDTNPPMAGTLTMKYVRFKQLGKGGLDAAVKIEYSSGFDPLPSNTFEGCSWTDSLYYALHAVAGPTPLLITKNVFVHSPNGGIWTEYGSSKVNIVQNAIIGVSMSPKAPRSVNQESGGERVMNYAGIRADAAPSRMNGNVVAGSNDMGYMLPMEDCNTMNVFDNEATATIIGAFLLSRDAGNCQAANLYKVWKAAHIGIYLADVSLPTRLNTVLVSDCHEGIVPYFTLDTGYRRLWVNDAIIIGSSPLSSCSASLKCRAQTEADPYMENCNSIFKDTNFRRVGFLAVINSMNSKTCRWDKTFCRLVSPAYVYLACQFPFESTLFMDKGMGWTEFKRTTFAYWKETECGQTTRAISMNSNAAEVQWPTSFEQTTWHQCDDVAKFELSAAGLTGAFGATAAPCSDTGSGCMGLDQMFLQDLDGTLTGLSNTGFASVLPLTPRTESTWRSMCEVKLGPQDNLKLVDAMICPNVTTQLLEMNNLDLGAGDIKFGPLVLTPYAAEDNGFEGGASSSVGPFYAKCPCGWDFSHYHVLIKPSTSYYTEVMSFPGNFRLTYWSASPADSVLLEFFYPASEGLSVFVGNTDKPDPTLALSTKPTLADAHGTNMVDPQSQRFYLVMRGSEAAFKGQKDIVVKKTPTVQMTANVRISLEEFSGDSFTMNLAILLGIPPERIKVVDVQRRRRLQAGDSDGVSLGITILPSADAAASAAGGDGNSRSQGSLDAQATELDFVSQQLQASLSLPDFAAAAGGSVELDTFAAPPQQDRTKAVETPSSETDQPSEVDVTALANSRAAYAVSPTAPCPAQKMGVKIDGLLPVVELASDLASGASTTVNCASALSGFQGTIKLACTAGALTADPSGCLPSGCSQTAQVTIGATTAAVGPTGTLASGLIVSEPCSNINSEYSGTYTMSCLQGVLTVDANACASGCPASMSLSLLVADKAKLWSPSAAMSSGDAVEESCAAVNNNYEGTMKVYCYYGILSSDPSGCSPNKCDSGDTFQVVVGGKVADMTLATTMLSGEKAGLDCGSANPEYSGELKIQCQLGGLLSNDASCARVCPASMSLAVTLGSVTNSVSPRSQMASGEEQRFDCNTVNPAMDSTFYLECMDGELTALTDTCTGQPCSTSLTAQVTVQGQTGTISAPQELTDGDTFQVACSDINMGTTGVIEGLCKQGAIVVSKQECQEPCPATHTVSATVGGTTVEVSPSSELAHGSTGSAPCPSGYRGNIQLVCAYGVLAVTSTSECESLSTTTTLDNNCPDAPDMSASECAESCATTAEASVIYDGTTYNLSPTSRMTSGGSQDVDCPAGLIGKATLECFKGDVSLSSLDNCVSTTLELAEETVSTTTTTLAGDDVSCASGDNGGPSFVTKVGDWNKIIYAQNDLKDGQTEDRSCSLFGNDYQGSVILTCAAGDLQGDVSDCRKVTVESGTVNAVSGGSWMALLCMFLFTGLHASSGL